MFSGILSKKKSADKLSLTPKAVQAVKAVATTPTSLGKAIQDSVKGSIRGLIGFFSSPPPIVDGQKLAGDLNSVIEDTKQTIKNKSSKHKSGSKTSKAKTSKAEKAIKKQVKYDVVEKLIDLNPEQHPDGATPEAILDIEKKIDKIAEK